MRFATPSATAFDSYDYDNNGNVLSITDGATGRNQRGNRDMTYDPLDRLLTAASPMFGNGATGTASFTYDALDNLTKLAMPATATTPARTQFYCYDANWRLGSLRSATACGGTVQTSLTYDTHGNLATKGSQAYTFGDNNRLYSVNGKESYRYDANGRRVLEWNAQGLGNILSDYDSSGQLLVMNNARTTTRSEYIYFGGSLVAVRDTPTSGGASTIKYQHTDALGTPVAITDANRNVIERSEYEPYGQLLNRPIKDGPGFTGHVQDAQTGLTYMQQRYYDPMIGRFLSVDPVTATSVGGNFNRYWYAADNPYRFADPDGREPCLGSLCHTYKGSRCQMTCLATDAQSEPQPAPHAEKKQLVGVPENATKTDFTYVATINSAIDYGRSRVERGGDQAKIDQWNLTTWHWDPDNPNLQSESSRAYVDPAHPNDVYVGRSFARMGDTSMKFPYHDAIMYGGISALRFAVLHEFGHVVTQGQGEPGPEREKLANVYAFRMIPYRDRGGIVCSGCTQ